MPLLHLSILEIVFFWESFFALSCIVEGREVLFTWQRACGWRPGERIMGKRRWEQLMAYFKPSLLSLLSLLSLSLSLSLCPGPVMWCASTLTSLRYVTGPLPRDQSPEVMCKWPLTLISGCQDRLRTVKSFPLHCFISHGCYCVCQCCVCDQPLIRLFTQWLTSG